MNFSLRERKGDGGEKEKNKEKSSLAKRDEEEQGGGRGEKKVDCKLERYKTGKRKLQTLRRVVAIF